LKVLELKLLVAVAEELHFGRAAERLGIAQPQLSASIRRIEQEAGLSIFTRRPRVVITPGGAEMVDMARRVLAELQLGTVRARAIAAGQTGRIALGFSSPAMCSDLPAILQAFLAGKDDVELRLVEGNTANLRERLEQRELDLIVTREPALGGALESIKLHHDRMNIVLPSSHPAASNEALDPKDLAQERVILFARSSAPHYYDRISLWCRDNGLELEVARETDSWIAVLGMVSAGLGVALGTELLGRIPFPGVVYRQLGREPLDVSFWMSWNPRGASPAATKLVQQVRQRQLQS
jgi:DNA-binding transcriptional LysR family regulator